MKGFEGLAFGPVPETAVGEDAVDIEQHEPDALGACRGVAGLIAHVR
jgi:hypothetical protein